MSICHVQKSDPGASSTYNLDYKFERMGNASKLYFFWRVPTALKFMSKLYDLKINECV